MAKVNESQLIASSSNIALGIDTDQSLTDIATRQVVGQPVSRF